MPDFEDSGYIPGHGVEWLRERAPDVAVCLEALSRLSQMLADRYGAIPVLNAMLVLYLNSMARGYPDKLRSGAHEWVAEVEKAIMIHHGDDSHAGHG